MDALAVAFAVSRREFALDEMGDEAPREYRYAELERQIDPDRTGQHRYVPGSADLLKVLVEGDDDHADCCADTDHRPWQLAAEDSFRDGGHQVRLRCKQRVRVGFRRYADTISLREQAQHWRHNECARNTTDREHELLFPGCRTEDIAALQILQVVAADAGRAAHDGTDHDRCHGTDRRTAAKQCRKHQRGKQDRCNRQA